MKLFLAEGKKIHLSPAGERLLHAATTLKNDEVFLRKQMLEGPGGTEPAVRDHQDNRGVSDIRPSGPLYPQPSKDRISVVINNTDELLHKLVSGEIQFALVGGIMMTWILIPWFSGQSPSYLYVLPAMYLPGSGQLRDLLGNICLYREPGSGTRDILEESGYQEYPPV